MVKLTPDRIVLGLVLCLLHQGVWAHPQTTAQQATITTVVGGGFTAPAPSSAAYFNFSVGQVQAVAVDSSGILYIADATHGSIYSINTNYYGGNPNSNSVALIAGNGTPNNTPVLQNPTGLALDGKGNLFVADLAAGMVYEIAIASGAVQTVAGCGPINNYQCPGPPDYGDNGKATSAYLKPANLFIDANGDIFIADVGTCRIRKVDGTGTITTFAGSTCPTSMLTGMQAGDGGQATSAQLYAPQGVIVDASENVFISDTGDKLVREVCGSAACGTVGVIKTVAGGGTQDILNTTVSMNGVPATAPATTVGIMTPQALAIDSTGDLYIADPQHNVVDVVNTSASQTTVEDLPLPSGNISLVAGNGSAPANTDLIENTSNLNMPVGLALGAQLYIADSGDYAVRAITPGGHNRNLIPIAGNFAADTFVSKLDPHLIQLATPLAVTGDAAGDIYLGETTATDLYYPPTAGYPNEPILGNGIHPGQASSYVIKALLDLSSSDLFAQPSLPPGGLFLDTFNDLYIADGGFDELSQTYGTVSLVDTTVYTTYPGSIRGVSGDNTNDLYISTGDDVEAYPAPVVLGGSMLSGAYPYAGKLGDGGPVQNATFGNITGLCLDGAKNLYITDDVTDRVRVVNTGQQEITIAGVAIPGNNFINTVAGGGGQAPMDPYSHFDLEPDTIGEGGLATNAFVTPQGCFVDNVGNIYIADGYNDRVREIVAATGKIYTISGSRIPGFGGDTHAAVDASLSFPNAVWGDQAGNLWISDSGNHRIRKLAAALPVPIADFSCKPLDSNGDCSFNNTSSNPAETITLTNSGSAPLIIFGLSSTNTTDFSVSGSCPSGGSELAVNASCQITVTPLGTTGARTNVIVDDNAAQNNAFQNVADTTHLGQWSGYNQTTPVSFTYEAPAINVAPISVVFTAEQTPVPITITNNGQVPLVISGVAVPPPFVIQTPAGTTACSNTPFSLQPSMQGSNSSCAIYVAFNPLSSQAAVNNNLYIAITDNTSTTTNIGVVGYALMPKNGQTFGIANQPESSVTATFILINLPAGTVVQPLCSVMPAGLDVTMCSYDVPSQVITVVASIPSCTLSTTAVSRQTDRGRLFAAGAVGFLLLLPWGQSKQKRLSALLAFAALAYVTTGLSGCSNTSQLSSACVASIQSGAPPFNLYVTANPITAGQFPPLTLTSPDIINVTQ